MSGVREIKKRIKSVKNIAQIARALEAEAATKVRKAQARALASRAYAEKAWEILLNVQSASPPGASLHPLLTAREEINTILVVLVTSDRGLAGAYNANIIRVAMRFAQRMNKPVKYVAVGKKGRDSLIRAGKDVVAEFTGLSARPTLAELAPISRLVIDEFLSGDVDDVFIAYTDFINTLTQRPAVLGWLPLIPHTVEDQVAAEFVKDVPQVTTGGQDYEYEPSPQAILDEIVPRFTELQLYQAVLEAQASEYSARMVAMRNASENASQLTDDLTLEYNKARQAAITSEILDIVGGAESLQDTLDKKADDLLRASDMANATASALSASSNGGGAKAKATPKPAPKKQAKQAKKKPAKTATAVATPDDLTKIEGIGPKMSAALIAAGIDTYAKLADSTEDALNQAIQDAGMRLAPSLGTWAEQSALARDGKWEELDALQDSLQGGRRT